MSIELEIQNYILAKVGVALGETNIPLLGHNLIPKLLSDLIAKLMWYRNETVV